MKDLVKSVLKVFDGKQKRKLAAPAPITIRIMISIVATL